MLRRAGVAASSRIDAKERAADRELRASRELGLDEPVWADPGPVRAPRVAYVHAIAHPSELEVHAARARVVEHENRWSDGAPRSRGRSSWRDRARRSGRSSP